RQVASGDGQARGVRHCAFVVYGHGRRAAADVHHGDALPPFLVGQDTRSGGDGVQDDVIDLYPRAFDAFRQVLHCGNGAGHDVRLGIEPRPEHAHRVRDRIRPFDPVAARLDVDDLAIRGDTDLPGCFHHAGTVVRA